MYRAHPSMKEPDDKQLVIRRYMNLAKFMDLLQTSCLFFPTMKQLKKYEPYEGSLTSIEVETYEKLEQNTHQLGFSPLKERVKYDERSNETTIVSCWHTGEESAAMWKIYASDGEGIAIESTYERLTHCLDLDNSTCPFDESVSSQIVFHGAMVQYIDHHKINPTDMNDPFFRVSRKYAPYEFEHELRIVADLVNLRFVESMNDEVKAFYDTLQEDGGYRIHVDLQFLLNRIIVTTRQPWYEAMVRKIVDDYNKSHVSKPPLKVETSRLYTPLS